MKARLIYMFLILGLLFAEKTEEALPNFKFNHGTIVRWVKPNRVTPKTAKSLSDHVYDIAGRKFWYFLQGFEEEGQKYKTDINIYVYNKTGTNYEIDKNDTKEKIKAFDPMFLMKDTQMDVLFTDSIHPTSQMWDKPIKKTFKVDIDLGKDKIEEAKGKIEIII